MSENSSDDFDQDRFHPVNEIAVSLAEELSKVPCTTIPFDQAESVQSAFRKVDPESYDRILEGPTGELINVVSEFLQEAGVVGIDVIPPEKFGWVAPQVADLLEHHFLAINVHRGGSMMRGYWAFLPDVRSVFFGLGIRHEDAKKLRHDGRRGIVVNDL